MSPRPLLTVAIPAYDNGHLLRLALRSLTRQTMPADRFEVVVVDDGSQPPLEPVIAEFTGTLDIVHIRQSRNRGRSVTRNRAIAEARSDVVMFLDADHCVHPEAVRRHWEFHAARDFAPGVLLGRSLVVDWAAVAALTQGRTPEPAEVGDYGEDIRDYVFSAAHRRRDWVRAPWVTAYSGNASVDRATLLAIGGFDEDLHNWGGEDFDLFYRVFHHHGGDPGVFVMGHDVVCYHLPHFRVWSTLIDQLARNYQTIWRKHRRYDIELFGLPGHSGVAVKRIMWAGDAIEACRKHGLGQVARLPGALREEVLRTGSALVVGFGASGLALAEESVTFDHDAPLTERNPHLVGLKTPYGDGRFDRVVNVDLWRFLGPEDLGGLVTEALRVGGRLDLVSTDATTTSAAMLPLPFAADLGYVRTMLSTHLDAELSHVDGCDVLSVRRRPA
jgi:glycosyltransferase involved in cell wall biosynthesis